jgi:hypothetical protein
LQTFEADNLMPLSDLSIRGGLRCSNLQAKKREKQTGPTPGELIHLTMDLDYCAICQIYAGAADSTIFFSA